MKTKKDKRSALEKEIDRIYEELAKIDDPTDERYTELQGVLQNLMDVKVSQKEATDDKKWMELVKPVIVGMFGIAQIGIILHHEEIGVISTKALGFILKGRA